MNFRFSNSILMKKCVHTRKLVNPKFVETYCTKKLTFSEKTEGLNIKGM